MIKRALLVCLIHLLEVLVPSPYGPTLNLVSATGTPTDDHPSPAARTQLSSTSSRNGMSLWIDEKQVREFSVYPMEIYAISDGKVLPYILDPNFEKYLPVIPSEVTSFNFTWRSGDHLYYYHFDRLQSSNNDILKNPVISIARKGKVPINPKVFQVFLVCSGNKTGIASFEIGLRIQNERGRFLPGMPLRLHLQKQCVELGPDPECDKKCANKGHCNQQKICECPKGYMGKYCSTALCYPQCMNGGTCISPGVCQCAAGYQGPHCEGGICREKCLNGGKCIQKDTCSCRRGYYGARCEFSKCIIPCLNAGRCIGVNRCRCRKGFTGRRCHKKRKKRRRKKKRKQKTNSGKCKKPCKHGRCENGKCKCDRRWFGRRCGKRRHPRRRKKKKHEIYV